MIQGIAVEHRVNANSDKVRSPRQALLRHIRSHSQKTSRFTRSTDPPNTGFNNSLHFRVPGVIRVAQRRRKIRRSNKHAINPFDVEDFVQVTTNRKGVVDVNAYR